jgi:predicted ATPase
MKIISLRIKNNLLGWDFDEVDFSSNLTLLVGISGAGKTQILRAILDLKRIANGKSINGLEWKIKFSTVNGNEFIWEGSFDTIETDESFFENDVEIQKPSLINEKLHFHYKDDLIIDRNQEKIKFKNQEMPKFSSHQSMIYILREDSVIQEIYDTLNKIEYRDNTEGRLLRLVSSKPLHFLTNQYKTLENIVNSDEDILTNIYRGAFPVLVYDPKQQIVTQRNTKKHSNTKKHKET